VQRAGNRPPACIEKLDDGAQLLERRAGIGIAHDAANLELSAGSPVIECQQLDHGRLHRRGRRCGRRWLAPEGEIADRRDQDQERGRNCSQKPLPPVGRTARNRGEDLGRVAPCGFCTIGVGFRRDIRAVGQPRRRSQGQRKTVVDDGVRGTWDRARLLPSDRRRRPGR
jgi:hypothetical protein